MSDLRRFGRCTLEDDGCTTCGDTGVPVRVLRVLEEGLAAVEDAAGRRARIRTDFTPGAGVGDVLLVHVGVAIARLEGSGADGSPDAGPAPTPRPGVSG